MLSVFCISTRRVTICSYIFVAPKNKRFFHRGDQRLLPFLQSTACDPSFSAAWPGQNIFSINRLEITDHWNLSTYLWHSCAAASRTLTAHPPWLPWSFQEFDERIQILPRIQVIRLLTGRRWYIVEWLWVGRAARYVMCKATTAWDAQCSRWSWCNKTGRQKNII